MFELSLKHPNLFDVNLFNKTALYIISYIIVVIITLSPQKALNIMLPFFMIQDHLDAKVFRWNTEPFRAGLVRGMVLFVSILNDPMH